MQNHPEVERLRRVAEWLYRKGWAEANAGNMSVRLDPGDGVPRKKRGETFPLKHAFPSLAGVRFLVTATGRRMRDLPRDPAAVLGMVEIVKGGAGYSLLWGSAPVTSEFPSHLCIHAMCVSGRPDKKAVLHTHPPHVIAMTQLSDLRRGETFNKALERMHPEVPIRLPRGVVLLDYDTPGSWSLGEATRDALRTHDVAVWSVHGLVALAGDADQALDLAEVAEKAAEIYLLARSAGTKPVGLSDREVDTLRDAFNIRETNP
jgi:rhamnulose-1-phosphate aldolase